MGMVFIGLLVPWDDFTTAYHILLKAVAIKTCLYSYKKILMISICRYLRPFCCEILLRFKYLALNFNWLWHCSSWKSYILFMTTVLQSVVVKIFCAVENVFVRWQFVYSLLYAIGEIFGDVWWVVGVNSDI